MLTIGRLREAMFCCGTIFSARQREVDDGEQEASGEENHAPRVSQGRNIDGERHLKRVDAIRIVFPCAREALSLKIARCVCRRWMSCHSSHWRGTAHGWRWREAAAARDEPVASHHLQSTEGFLVILAPI